jgi:hypothetical protein
MCPGNTIVKKQPFYFTEANQANEGKKPAYFQLRAERGSVTRSNLASQGGHEMN